MGLDRRQHARQIVDPDVYVDLVPNNAGWLSNISEDGLALDLFIPAVSGEAVRLGFELPGTSNRIEANCRIAWIDRLGRKAGLRFLDLPETTRQQIRESLIVPTPSLGSRLAGLLVELFVCVLALCGLTFAFVYMLGLAESSPRPRTAPSANNQTVSPSGNPSALARRTDTSGTDSMSSAPLISKGAIVLQVAALTQEDSALAMAEALRKKNFPAFVLGPSTHRYYLVWVGPYADTDSAIVAKRMLEKVGFKAILKR